MLSTCPLNSRPPSASTSIVAALAGAHVFELRLLEVGRRPRRRRATTSAISGWPGCTTWPTSTVLRLTMPAVGALIVVRSRFSSACASAACICLTRASAPAARALRDLQLLRAPSASSAAPPRPGDRGRGPGRARCSATAIAVSAAATSDFAASAAARAASAAATAASNCCCEISSFATSGLSRSTSLRVLRCRRLALAQPRLGGDELRLRGFHLAVGDADARLRLFDAAGGLTDVGARGHLGNRHARACGGRGRLRVGELGARAIDRHLIVARIDLARATVPASTCWLSLTDLHDRAADARRQLRDVPVHLRVVGALLAGGHPRPRRRAMSAISQHRAADQRQAACRPGAGAVVSSAITALLRDTA